MFKRSRGSKPIPKNSRAVGVARQSIDFLGSTMQRTLQNAITGDGHHCLLYIPRTHGIRCTCINEDPLDTNGKMRPEVMDSILSNELASIGDYRDTNALNVNKLVASDAPSSKYKTPESRPKLGGKGYEAQVFTLESLDEDGFDADDFDLSLDDGFSNEAIPTLQNGYVPTTSASSTSCPICLSIGWVGGFELYAGTRLVLPASSATNFNGCSLVNENPDYAKMSAESSISYSNLVLPAGVSRIDEISVWNNRNRIPFNVKVDGQLLANIDDLGNYFDGKPHTLEFSPVLNSNVTHVSLQYATTDILIDVSKKSISNSNTVYDQQSEVSLVLPAVTQKILKGAIVFDSAENKYYRVHSMGTSNTQGGWVQNLDLDARIVQPYELATLLPVMNRKNIKRFGGSFNNTAQSPKKF